MKNTLFLLVIFISTTIFSQDLVLIKFTDKPSADYFFENPNLMLSQKSLDRRLKYGIELTLQDIPVEETYVNQIEDTGINPIAISKWFNGIFAWCTEAQILQVEAFSFVSEVESLVRNSTNVNSGKVFSGVQESQNITSKFLQPEYVDYGATETQVKQIKLDYLHDLGFTGEGISIAVLDNGFPGVNTQDGFAYIRDNGQIKATYNFVTQNEDVYNVSGTHGTVVLSTIGGYIENQFIGTAIDADYYLFITENNQHELPDEEINWIAAAELADSLGVDVINTSLGYSEFDDSRYNYTYTDMDGATTYITRGAQFAAERGIMVVVSAGNSGSSEWHYITAPADGVDIFTIGAVRNDNVPASFSSYGPTSDGRIKPDVDALGSNAAIIRPNGTIDYGSGTSFSSPIMSGAMACLIQAFPETHPSTLRQNVRESAHLFNNPTDQMGYGIPDFSEAYEACLGTEEFDLNTITIYPNPTSGIVQIDSKFPIKQLQLISFSGAFIRKLPATNQLNISELPKGIYILKIQLENGQNEIKRLILK